MRPSPAALTPPLCRLGGNVPALVGSGFPSTVLGGVGPALDRGGVPALVAVGPAFDHDGVPALGAVGPTLDHDGVPVLRTNASSPRLSETTWWSFPRAGE